MLDLTKYIDKRKKTDKEFAEGYREGYKQFNIGVMLRQARESAGLTQEELALRLNTQKKRNFENREPCRRHQTVNPGAFCSSTQEAITFTDFLTQRFDLSLHKVVLKVANLNFQA
jgi:hypothetical protein